MQDFRKLRVWQTAFALTIAIYKATRQFPSDERFGLCAQIRTSAASIGANIAEGCGRSSDAELRRFLHIALGSAKELHHHLLLAHALTLISNDECAALVERADHVSRMLSALLTRLRPNRTAK